jgi:hypothetical protein
MVHRFQTQFCTRSSSVFSPFLSLTLVEFENERITRRLQELAAARMSAMPDIFAATSSADCALVLDHLVVNPSCIFLREDGRYESAFIPVLTVVF